MAMNAVTRRGVSIALAYRAFEISETCYRYSLLLSDENEEIADWLERLTANKCNWGLGLCFFHLFTGNCPYEELLEEVTCPPNLRRLLEDVWDPADKSGTDFALLSSLINADVYEEGDEKDFVLFDTLYRYARALNPTPLSSLL